jgi:CheY-like chemotaxis protein
VALEHARLVLELAGITTETAKSGKEAVEMVKLRHGRREPFNLIIIDWKMPEMDGVETTRQIRATTGDESAIIILTAYNWDDVLDEAIRAGVDSFVAKPIFTGALLDEFKKVLKKKQNALLGSPKKAELRGKRILLAEDVDVNAQIMENVLAMREIQTDIATNGKIALEKFSERPAGYYDAILMDIRMPEMDGLEATAAIRKLDREDAQKIPIIALTANAFDEDVQRSLQAGMNAHLSKPIQPEALFETLETILS